MITLDPSSILSRTPNIIGDKFTLSLNAVLDLIEANGLEVDTSMNVLTPAMKKKSFLLKKYNELISQFNEANDEEDTQSIREISKNIVTILNKYAVLIEKDMHDAMNLRREFNRTLVNPDSNGHDAYCIAARGYYIILIRIDAFSKLSNIERINDVGIVLRELDTQLKKCIQDDTIKTGIGNYDPLSCIGS